MVHENSIEEKRPYCMMSSHFRVLCMSTTCLLFLDDLSREEEVSLAFELDPSFLDLTEKDEAQPSKPIVAQGTASLVGEFICLNLDVQCSFMLPCALCNEKFEYEVSASIEHQEPVENIKQRKWDFTDLVREAILLEVPFFPQCGGETCRHRDEIQKYLVNPEEK